MRTSVFKWKNLFVFAVVLCAIACLFFFSAFWTVDTEYYSMSLNGFMWIALIGTIGIFIWALPYVIGFIARVIRYCYRKVRYGYAW